jgi:hypothetical protein
MSKHLLLSIPDRRLGHTKNRLPPCTEEASMRIHSSPPLLCPSAWAK